MRDECFGIGDHVQCEGTACGRLTALAVDPAKNVLAHLIVDPGRSGPPRLVPARHAHVTADGITLDCTRHQFDAMEPAAVIHIDPAESGAGIDEERRWRRHDEISSWPVFGLGSTVPNPSIGAPAPLPAPTPHVEIEDHVPAGEVRVHEALAVHAADGDIGRAAGVATDPGDKRLTGLLVDEGHLWRHKRVAIPMTLVRSVTEDGIRIRLSKRQIKTLPPVEEEHG